VIVDPDFLDHWRTGMVADALGDQLAPVYIMRLWGHCQERRSDTFVMPTKGLKAQCKFPGDADLFERALSEAGFIRRDGESIVVVGWADKNAALFAAWENGQKGGRPRKPIQNPSETHGKPSGNPSLTQTKPIREEKRREETEGRAARFSLPDWIPADAWKGYEDMRVRIKKPITDRARALVVKELDKLRAAGHDPSAVLDRSTVKGWTDVYPLKGSAPSDDPYGLKDAL
jgi:hypothetical protein